MKGYVKCIIAGAVILGIGIAVLIIALAVNGWKFDFKETEYEMKTYETKESYDTLNIDFNAGELEIVFYEGEKIKFEYPENNRYTASVTEQKSSVSFVTKKKHWFDWFSWSTNFPKTTISIPENSKLNLTIELNAGKVTVPDGEYINLTLKVNAGDINANTVTASSINCAVNAGNVKIENATCTKANLEVNAGNMTFSRLDCGEITVDTNVGNMSLGVVGTATEYTVDIDNHAGTCNVENHTGASGKSIKGELNLGTFKVSFIH